MAENKSPKKPTSVISDKQLRFCEEYVIDLNGTQAAIRAGYSEKTANEQAARLLAKVSIKGKIKELQAGISKRLQVSADMVVQELAKIGFSNVHDFIKHGNDIKDLSKLEREMVAPVAGIKVTEAVFESGSRTTTELKFHDKVAALVNLGKYTGIFERDNSQKSDKIIVTLK